MRSQMVEIGFITPLFSALGIGLLGFVLGALAMSVRWMKSEDSDLKRGYIEIAGNCYQLHPIEDSLLSHRRQMPPVGIRPHNPPSAIGPKRPDQAGHPQPSCDNC